MKKFFAAAAMLLMMGALCFAQDKKPELPQKKNNYWEQIKAEKIGFITQKLDLTVEEAQVFWPVYNQYEKTGAVAGKNLRKAMKAMNAKEEEALTDKEMNERINVYLKAKKEYDSVLADFNKEFLKVLPATKVAKLYVAEEQFKKVVFDKYSHRPNPQHMHKGVPAEKPVQPKPKPAVESECQTACAPAN